MQTNQDRKFSSRVYIFTGGGGREGEKNEKENYYCTYEKDKSEENSCFYVIEIFKRGNIGREDEICETRENYILSHSFLTYFLLPNDFMYMF